MIQAEGLSLPGYIRDMAKADSGPMNVRGPQKKGNPLQSGNSSRGISKASMSKVVRSFPLTVEDGFSQDDEKIHCLW